MTRDQDQAYARYCALRDRQAAGALLTDDEVVFCERMEREHPACRRELSFFADLSDMDGASSEAARSLVAATMDAIAQGALDDAEPSGEEPAHAGQRLWAPRYGLLGIVSLVAAVALWTLAPQSLPPRASQSAASPSAPAEQGPRRVELVYSSGATRVDGTPLDAEGSSSTGLLRAGQRVAAGDGGLCLVMDPGINICLDEHSELELSQLSGAHQRLSLLRGRVALALDPQPRGFDITVVAGGVESTAVGTIFSVALNGEDGEEVLTSVLEGKVRVGANGSNTMVVAHERHNVAGETRETRALSRRDEAPEWAIVEATRLWRGRLSGTLAVEGSPAGAEVWLDGRRIGVTPLSSLIPAGAHRLQIRHEDRLLREESLAMDAGQRAVVRYTPPPAAATRNRAKSMSRRPLPVAAAEVPSTEALLDEARRLMLDGRFRQAAQTYRALRVAHPDSREARTVLVPLAELELERLDEPTKALTLADEYLRQKQGPLRHEAMYTRVRALRRLGRTSQERASIEGLLQAFPTTFHADELQARLDELAR